MKKLNHIHHLTSALHALILLVILGVGAICITPVLAAKCPGSDAEVTGGGYSCVGQGSAATGLGGDQSPTLESMIQTIINVVLWAVGVISVGFIIYGGVKYAMSSGDSAKVKSAKDTLLYAVIGLIVSLLAYAIVGFITGQFVTTVV